MESEFYYPDELTDELDILNASETEFTKDIKQKILKNSEKKPTSITTSTTSQDEDDIFTKFITEQQSKSTVTKTRCDVNNFKKFCSGQNEERELQDIPVEDLNKLLCKFFMSAVKKNGDLYEPDTLTSIQRSIQRKLQELNVSHNILKDQEFQRSREVLAAKRKSLVAKGKGNKPNATRPLTDDEEDKLFSVGYFGDHEPLTLQRTLWWVFSLHFGFRARDESHKLRWGDVQLTEDPETGNEVISWLAERVTKTRSGKENGHRRAFSPTAQANNTVKCPVLLYKAFRSHRPTEMNQNDSPFYLAINHNRIANSEIWYKKCPLGKNEIGKFLSKAVQCGHLGGIKKVANHSVRKTSIGRLLDANCPETFVAQLSGHKSLNSLSHYKVPSLKHQRIMSNVLSRTDDSQSFLTSSGASTEYQGLLSNCEKPSLLTASTQVQRELHESNIALQPAPLLQSQSINSAQHAVNPHELFRGSSIGSISGCTFNFYSSLPSTSTCSEPPPVKRRRRAYFLDSDSE